MTVIVLLPGMDGSGTLFDDFVSALGSKVLVISYPPDQPLSYEQLEATVERALPTNEPYVLLGESFSGPIAIRLASKNLPALRAVVLVCTFARLHRRRLSMLLSTLFGWFPFWRLPISVGSVGLLGRFDSAGIRLKLTNAIKSVAPSVWRIRLRSVLEVDVTAELEHIRCPLLYLRGYQDWIVPAAASELISRINPSTKIVSIDGPHALLQTRPEACASAVRDFAQDAGLAL